MYIDALTHVTPDGRWFNTSYDASEMRLLREMDNSSIDQAMVVGLVDATPNEYILNLCVRYPNRLIPCAGFNPVAFPDPEQAAAAFADQILDAGFRAVKLHPRMGRYDLEDPRVTAVLSANAAARHSLPVWICGLLHHPAAPLSRGPEELFHALGLRFPNTRFVVAHAGGTRALSLAEAVSALPNVFLDLSYTLARYRGFSLVSDLQLLAQRFEKRLLWGSDFPEVGIPVAKSLLEEFLMPLVEEKRKAIRSGTFHAIMEPIVGVKSPT